METSSKLDQDFKNLNTATEQRAEQEIKKIRADVNALKEQAAKNAEALMNTAVVSEKSP